MSKHSAVIFWERNKQKFNDNKYSRFHQWKFDGGKVIPASSSPHEVPAPFSDPSAVDPEEAFVASLSSCHMLWFLSIAANRGFVVEQYRDKSEGEMGTDKRGNRAILTVKLNPVVTYLKNSAPNEKINDEMHEEAHKKCFIANSVRTKISLNPSIKKSGAA